MKKFLSKYWYAIVVSVALAVAITLSIVCFVTLGGNTKVDTTSVGYIGFGNRTSETEIKNYLSNRVSSWKKDTNYTIEYQGTTFVIQTRNEDNPEQYDRLSILDFDVDKTYKLAKKNVQGNPAYFNINNDALADMHEEMVRTFGLETVNGIDMEVLLGRITKAAQTLTRTIEIPLHECLNEAVKKYEYNGWIFSLMNLDKADVLALDGKEIEINPGYFSLLNLASIAHDPDQILDENNQVIGYKQNKYDLSTLTNRQLSILASGLAKVIQETSFQAITKTQEEGYKVSYATGTIEDILVSIIKPNSQTDLNSFDFSFVNPEKYSFTFTISRKADDQLEFKLIGYKYAVDYEIVKSVTELAYKTTIKEIPSSDASFGEMTDDEKKAYLIENGYERMTYLEYCIKYKDVIFEGENFSDKEIEEGLGELGSYDCFVKVETEGKTGYQVDYYRRVVHPDGTVEPLSQTIYTSPECFWQVDEVVSSVSFLPIN